MHAEQTALIDRLRLPTLSARGLGIVTGVLAVVAVAALTAGTLSSLAISPTAPIDFGDFGPPGARLLTGQWTGVFENPIIQAGPFELAFWGIAQLLGVSTPTGWLVFLVLAGSVLLAALAVVIERPLRSVAGPWSVPLAATVATLTALSGAVVMVLVDGHPAQLAISILWLAAGLAARKGHPMTAAALLGLTAGWEVWGLLGAPILLLAPRIDGRTIWRSAVGGLAIVAVLFVPFVLLGPFRMFEFSWGVRPNTLPSILFPGAIGFPWPLRLAQGLLSIGSGIGVALAVRRSLHAVWLVPLVICCVRLVFDPVLANYYLVAPTVLALFGLVLCAAQRSFVAALACLVTFNVLVDLRPLGMPILTAAVVALLTVAAVVAVVIRTERTDAALRTAPAVSTGKK